MIRIIPLPADFQDWTGLLSLIMKSFAYMDGVIDPPSSAHRLTPQSLAQKAVDETCFLAVDDGTILGCVFCKVEQPDCLYIGKLAVAPSAQGQGLGRKLVAAAEDHAKALGLTRLRLETRIELIRNHAAFGRLGFAKTAENRHAGFNRTTSIEMQKAL